MVFIAEMPVLVCRRKKEETEGKADLRLGHIIFTNIHLIKNQSQERLGKKISHTDTFNRGSQTKLNCGFFIGKKISQHLPGNQSSLNEQLESPIYPYSPMVSEATISLLCQYPL